MLNILLILLIIQCSALLLKMNEKSRKFINKTDGSNMEIVCILDHDIYCIEHYVGFLFSDGCRRCICKQDGAYCTSKTCIDYQATETNPEDYCRKLVEKNENGTSTISDSDRNVTYNHYNLTYIHKPRNETDDEVNDDEDNSNRIMNNITKETDENVTSSPLYTEENPLTDDDSEKMNFSETANNTYKLEREIEEQPPSFDIHRQNNTVNGSVNVPIKNIENNSVFSLFTNDNVSLRENNQSLKLNEPRSHKVKNISDKLPITYILKDQGKDEHHRNSSFLNNEQDSEYNDEVEREGSKRSLSRNNNERNLITRDKYNDNTEENKLLLVDDTMQNDESSNQTDEEKIIKNISPVMNLLSDTLYSNNLDSSFATPAENIVNKELIGIVMDNNNGTNNTSNHVESHDLEDGRKHQDVSPADRNVTLNKEKENPPSNQPVNTTDSRLAHQNVSKSNKRKQSHQRNATTQDDSNNWVSREITVNSRTVKLPNEKAMKNMHQLFPNGELPYLELEEKDTQSYDDTVHGKHIPHKSPLQSVSFTSHRHDDQLMEKLDLLLKNTNDIKYYLEMLKPCWQQTQQRHHMMKMHFNSKLPKNKLLTF